VSLLLRSLDASISVGLVLCLVALAIRCFLPDARARYMASYGALVLIPLASAGVSVFAPPVASATPGLDQRLLIGLWFLGLAVSIVRLVLSFAGVVRLLRRAVQSDLPHLVEAAERCAARLGMRRVPQIRLCVDRVSPCTIGVLKPIVLIPAAVLSGLTPAQLEAIVAHELAHVKRWDYWANLLQILVESLLFFHPGVWLLSHVARLDRELCCDELAVRVLGDRTTYADALAQAARLQAPWSVPAFTTGHLASRILGVLGRRSRVRLQLPRLAFGVVVALFLMLTVSAFSATRYVQGRVTFESDGKHMVIDFRAPAGTQPIFRVRPR
jgi:beta-lactamase regulating signal transducer with metallopeptidase domain